MSKFPLTNRCLKEMDEFGGHLDISFAASGCVAQKLSNATAKEELQARLLYEDLLNVRLPENNENYEHYIIEM